MRLAVTFLGLDLFSLEITTDEDDDTERDLSGGATTSTAVGFTAKWELPDGASRPEYDE